MSRATSDFGRTAPWTGIIGRPNIRVITAILSGGSVVIRDTSIKATSFISPVYQKIYGTPGILSTIVEANQVQILSTSPSDGSTLRILIVDPPS